MAYSFSSQDFTSVNEVTELESFSISKLVTCLKSSFRKESFKLVEKILSLREEKLKFEKEKVIKHAEGLEEELRDYKDSYSKSSMRIGKLESANAEIEVEFKEKVKRVEEDCNVFRERERRATERIKSLSSELENVSKEKNKELIELKTKIKEVECAKQKVDNELDMQKRKCKELEKENYEQKIRYSGLVKQVTNLEKECTNINLKLEVNEISEKEGKINETNGGENCSRLSMLNMKENTLSRDERVRHSSVSGSVHHSLAEASGSGPVEGPPTVNLLSKPFVNQREERKFPSSPKLVSVRSIHKTVIEIRDSESEDEATPASKLPKDCVIKTSSSQKDIENGSSHKEKYPSVSSCKRRRMVMRSDSEDDDRIPIGKLKTKKHEEVNHHSDSFGNQNFMASIVSSGLGRSRKAEKIPMKGFETDGTSSKKIGRPVAENTHENDVEEVGLDAKGRSLGEYGKKGSDAPDLTKIISGIRSWKANGLKWQYEVEMVSSFETDPTVCMRAVCALYRQHNIEKKAVAASGHSPKRGFCTNDEHRGTLLAEFLLDGNLDGEMKKSVEELKRYYPSGIDECKRLAKKYSHQLFTVYRSKEDPLFC